MEIDDGGGGEILAAHPAQKSETTWIDLPYHLLEAIGGHLYGNDYLAARLVCRTWRMAISPVTQTIKVHLHHPNLRPAGRLAAVKKAFPKASRLTLYVDATTGPEQAVNIRTACAATLQALSATSATTAAIAAADGSGGAGGIGAAGGASGPLPPTTAATAASTAIISGASGSSSSGGKDDHAGDAGSSSSNSSSNENNGLRWQYMSLTVGMSVLPLNRDQWDATTHRLTRLSQVVVQQVLYGMSDALPYYPHLRHLTTLELTAPPALFAALSRILAGQAGPGSGASSSSSAADKDRNKHRDKAQGKQPSSAATTPTTDSTSTTTTSITPA
ncbi:hypothetical protein Agub_g14937, partial [Astrephomene gubernaculifera]